MLQNGLNEMVVIARHGVSRELLNQFRLVSGMPQGRSHPTNDGERIAVFAREGNFYVRYVFR